MDAPVTPTASPSDSGTATTIQPAGTDASNNSSNPLSGIRPAPSQAALAGKWDAMEKRGNKPSEDKPDKVIDLETLDNDTPVEKVEPVNNEPPAKKPAEKVEEEVNFEPPVKKSIQQKDEVLTTQQLEAVTSKRDYSQFPQELEPVLRKLPNSQFNYAVEKIVPIFKQLGELKVENETLKKNYEQVKSGKLPDTYIEHPEAYKLSQEYANLEHELNYDTFEENHWNAQLLAIKQGQPWVKLNGYDPKSGQPLYEQIPASTEGKIDVQSELGVGRLLNQLSQQKTQRQGQLNSMGHTHKQQYQQSLGAVKEAENKFFPSFADASKITPEVKAKFDAVNKSLPQVFRNHPLTSVIQKSYAKLTEFAQMLGEKDKEITRLTSVLEDMKNTQPGKSTFNGGGGEGKGVKMLDIKDFE